MAYVRNAWYVASWSHKLAAGTAVAVKILGERIALWRDETGLVHALEDRCVHRHAPLSKGRCEGANLRCMYHGVLFDPKGKAIDIPGQEMIPAKAKVRSFPVLDLHGWIWVWMGEADAADTELVPKLVDVNDPQWQLLTDEISYDAEARLINDNLTDFSHLSYVHASSFGVNEAFAETAWKTTELPRGVLFERWSLSQPPLGQPQSPERQDVWIEYEYSIPGILSLTSRVFPAGAAINQFAMEPPPLDASPLVTLYAGQAVTPVEPGKSRYLFSTGFKAPMPEEAVQGLMALTIVAFNEDKVMIEGQQQVIDDDPDRPIMPFAGDRGVVLFNRLVEKLARAEGEAALPTTAL